jgi:hypothetical protein
MTNKHVVLILLSVLLFNCDSGVDKSKVAGVWSYSDSVCDGNDANVQGATLEIEFEVDGDGVRTFTSNSCIITNEFKWVLDGNNITIASKNTDCDPSNCSHDMEIDGTEFTLDCTENFEDVWRNSSFEINGNIAIETFNVENIECKNTYINPDL